MARAAALPVGLHDRDGNSEMWDAVKEVGGAVKRIDDPDWRLGIAFLDDAAFLHQEAPVRTGLCQFAADRLLGVDVGAADEVGRALPAHLQVFDLAEIAKKPLACID